MFCDVNLVRGSSKGKLWNCDWRATTRTDTAILVYPINMSKRADSIRHRQSCFCFTKLEVWQATCPTEVYRLFLCPPSPTESTSPTESKLVLCWLWRERCPLLTQYRMCMLSVPQWKWITTVIGVSLSEPHVSKLVERNHVIVRHMYVFKISCNPKFFCNSV